MASNRIRELRQARGLTLRAFARELLGDETRFGWLGKIERGDLEPNVDTTLQLARFFQMPVEALFYAEVVSKKNTNEAAS